jgi:hypothetical protein
MSAENGLIYHVIVEMKIGVIQILPVLGLSLFVALSYIRAGNEEN